MNPQVGDKIVLFHGGTPDLSFPIDVRYDPTLGNCPTCKVPLLPDASKLSTMDALTLLVRDYISALSASACSRRQLRNRKDSCRRLAIEIAQLEPKVARKPSIIKQINQHKYNLRKAEIEIAFLSEKI
jgi:hypothetical protein